MLHALLSGLQHGACLSDSQFRKVLDSNSSVQNRRVKSVHLAINLTDKPMHAVHMIRTFLHLGIQKNVSTHCFCLQMLTPSVVLSVATTAFNSGARDYGIRPEETRQSPNGH
jgi:hypothetical protein